MKSTNKISEDLRRMRVVADSIPLNCSQSIAVPAIVGGDATLQFLFYTAHGGAGQPKEIHPPLAKVCVDKRTGLVREMSFAPWIWRDGNSEKTVLGHFPNSSLREKTLAEVDQLYEQYGILTDKLLESATAASLSGSLLWDEWQQLFTLVCEDGLLPYFDIEIAPRLSMSDKASIGPTKPSVHSPNEPDSQQRRTVESGYEAIRRIIECADQVRSFLRSTCLPDEVLNAWISARKVIESNSYTVAVIGEFSRGKSTLVNGLIGEQLLPVGDLPTTATLARISGGQSRSITRIEKSGKRHQMEANIAETLSLALGDTETSDSVFQVTIDNRWLSESSIHLFDTPGAGDLSDNRIGVLSEAIATCDATVIAISALSPLSLTEQNFVEEHVFFHHVPNIALAITRLDQVPEKDRQSVVSFVREKVSRWAPSAEVWITSDTLPGVSTELPSGSAAMRERLSHWSQSASRMQSRVAQAAGQMGELVAIARSSLETQLELLQRETSERDEARSLAVQAVNARKLQWDAFAIELERRSLGAEQFVEDALRNQIEDLRTRLAQELSRCPKPHDWWENDLPFRLNQEMRALASKLNQAINEQIESDCKWLERSVTESFEESLGPRVSDKANIQVSKPSAIAVKTEDMARYQNYGRVISGVVTAGGFVLFGPIAGGASILGGLVTDRIFKGKTEDQKNLLQEVLAKAMQQMTTELLASSRDWIHESYKKIANATHAKGRTWQQSQLNALSVENAPPFDLPLQIKKADQLAKQLELIVGANQ